MSANWNSRPPDKLLSYDEAARLIGTAAEQILASANLPSEEIPLEKALGRVVAQAVNADRDQPAFNRSTRDGYALQADAYKPGAWIKVVGRVAAGQTLDVTVEPNAAVEIMTGAAVPSGADCVVMVEHTEARDGQVRILEGHEPISDANVVLRGAEAKAGAIVVAPGTRLEPRHIGLAAFCGAARVNVYKTPRVAIVATGDELVGIDQQPSGGQIRDSNSWSLAAQVRTIGGEAWRLPPAKDDAAVLRETILKASEADLILLSGGVSMGRYDLVEPVLEELGASVIFNGAKIQPGKPAVFGCLPREGKPPIFFFGLPGNPIATMVTFALFVAPVLAALTGAQHKPGFALAMLEHPWNGKAGLTRFLPASLRSNGSAIGVSIVRWQGSGDLTGNAAANCYMVVPDDRDFIGAGELVRVLAM